MYLKVRRYFSNYQGFLYIIFHFSNESTIVYLEKKEKILLLLVFQQNTEVV